MKNILTIHEVYDFKLNVRIWGLHLQISRKWKVRAMFAWYDFWIGLFFDNKKRIIYFFPVPTLGIRIEGIWIVWNESYKFKTDPFIRKFDCRRIKDIYKKSKVNTRNRIRKINNLMN